MSYNICASLGSGTPCLKDSKSPASALALILLALIPSAPSASGSRSPALITSILSNLYAMLPSLSGLPLYLLSNSVKLPTRSLPATYTMLVYPFSYKDFNASIIVLTLESPMFIFLKNCCAKPNLVVNDNGSVLGFCVWDKNI